MRALRLFGRALRLRCPACAGGPLFARWFQMRPQCPRCGLELEREEGYWMGALLVNLLVAEGLFVVGFVATLLLTWPHPPWTLLTVGAAVAVVVFPLILFPFSRTIWLALDLLFHPPERHEYGRDTPAPADHHRAP